MVKATAANCATEFLVTHIYIYLYIERKESVRIHKLELFTGKLWLYLGFLLTLHSIFKFLQK